MANPVVVFGKKLDSVLPEDIPAEDRLHIFFNIVLVKFGARPGTLIDWVGPVLLTPEGRLIHKFGNFIENDPDITYKFLCTESNDELWIYNVKYAHLFDDRDVCWTYDDMIKCSAEDISTEDKVRCQAKKELIHKTRGKWLGYPCTDYFLHAHGKESLVAALYLDDVKYTAWWCPPSKDYTNDAIDRWLLYRPYAEALGYNLSLRFSIEVV